MAAIEPESVGLADEQQQVVFASAVQSAAELVTKGELTAAVRPLADFVFDDEEIATLDDAGYLDATGRYIPNLINFIQQLMQYEDITADDPAVLSEVSAPVMVLQGSSTKPLAVTSARHVFAHVSDARIQEIPGAGHAAPLTHSGALAEFFEPVQQPA